MTAPTVAVSAAAVRREADAIAHAVRAGRDIFATCVICLAEFIHLSDTPRDTCDRCLSLYATPDQEAA